MSDARVLRKLDAVVLQLRRLRRARTLLAFSTGLAVLLAVLLWSEIPRGTLFVTFLLAFPVGALCMWVASRPRKSDRAQAARLVEQAFPDLDARLLASMHQHPQGMTGGRTGWEFGYLQSEVASQVLEHGRRFDWSRGVPGYRSTLMAALVSLTTCMLLVAMAPLQPFASSTPPGEQKSVETEPILNRALPFELSVEPGDTEVEQGRSLLVLARFGNRLPTNIHLIAQDDTGRTQRIPLLKNLDDPVYGGRIPEIDRSLTYHIEYDDQLSDSYSITTFTFPELVKANATLNFPEYTEIAPETLENIRRVSAVEGTNIVFDFQLNKPVNSAAFVDEEGNRYDLQITEKGASSATLDWQAPEPQRRKFRLELTDEQGRQNKNIPEFIVQVLPNRPPNLKVTFPARDTRVSPLEEMFLQAQVSDDFGLLQYGVVFETPDGAQEELVLGDRSKRNQKQTMDHLLRLEPLQVTPDQLISYYFFADDVGPDGDARRSFSEIYFSEIRPFEEIFREVPPDRGEQQNQQQQQEGEQSGGESGELLEVQRQIVSATWNLIRAESRKTPSKEFLPAAETLFESQEQALVMAEQLQERLQDEEMLLHLQEAMDLMTSTSRFFADAISNNKIAVLHEARSKAQGAYQALLKLNAREMQVQQSQQQQQQGQNRSSQQQNRQRQLDNLELKNDRDRYETERQAQQQQMTEQQQEARETLQVLNRLRELARRQEDLNEKIRDLENKLRDADEEERAALERELKRLQEEQEEMLRNLDELQERMNREENRDRMADAREQVDQTRERVLRASEALQENQTSRALTEGTRAQRELDQLQDELRRETANQFEQSVRQLRDDVRQLAERQQELSNTLRGDEQEQSPAQQRERRSLRTDDAAQPDRQRQTELAQTLLDEKERLSEVLDRTKELVEESEETEPLLSKKLYDAMRDLRTTEPEEALEKAAQMQRYGANEEARAAQAQALEGIRRLERGIEEAAQSILGNETESLLAANDMLRDLTQAIENELRQNAGGATDQSPADPGENRDPQRGTAASARGEPQPSTENGQPGQPGEQPNPQQPTGQATGRGTSEMPEESDNGERNAASRSGGAAGEAQATERGEPGEPSPTGERGANGERRTGESATDERPPRDPQSGEPMNGAPMTGEPGTEPQPGEAPSPSEQPGANQPGGAGQPGEPGQQGQQAQPGQQGETPAGEGRESQSQPGSPRGTPAGGGGQRSGEATLVQQLGNLFREQGASDQAGDQSRFLPLTGEEFQAWSDRMRDLEEMVTTPEMRSQVATIRDRARQMRVDLNRHSKAPDWDLVRMSIYGPMLELQKEIAEELARRDPQEKLVPIDRDPVPDRFSPLLKKYYEELARQNPEP